MLYTLVTFVAVSFIFNQLSSGSAFSLQIWTQQIMLASPTYDCSGSCGDDKPLSASIESKAEAPSPIVANDKDNNVDTARFMNQDDCSVCLCTIHAQKENHKKRTTRLMIKDDCVQFSRGCKSQTH